MQSMGSMTFSFMMSDVKLKWKLSGDKVDEDDDGEKHEVIEARPEGTKNQYRLLHADGCDGISFPSSSFNTLLPPLDLFAAAAACGGASRRKLWPAPWRAAPLLLGRLWKDVVRQPSSMARKRTPHHRHERHRHGQKRYGSCPTPPRIVSVVVVCDIVFLSLTLPLHSVCVCVSSPLDLHCSTRHTTPQQRQQEETLVCPEGAGFFALARVACLEVMYSTIVSGGQTFPPPHRPGVHIIKQRGSHMKKKGQPPT